MKKIVFQALVSTGLFFGLLFGLQEINWLSFFTKQKTQILTEEILGDIYWESFRADEKEITTGLIVPSVDSILTKICENNAIHKTSIKVHIIDNLEVNAFAFPNKHLILNRGLLLAAESDTELAGVICHEIAHIELNHVVKKMLKEVGLSVITSISSGNNNAKTVKKSAKLLSSSAYDRKLEKEADLKAVEYLNNAQIDVTAFANFLIRISLSEHINSKHPVWIDTHPKSEIRAKYTLENRDSTSTKIKSILTKNGWNQLKVELAK
ncbi:hypothetical protein BZG02_08155 [Labilibaculum filiforme]|uniref:Peptidase M48 domain-containing protein n=1 Tax=Labilibaculum filiforme TaxID=1940526 RepID=A0A2N3I0W8_9BACT|nr:M48 family metallopeptidase [Labilibaculum filiforme]PKQ63975.1 hypothetical protein BZG02_08155 [Labilibaculum filiforme]